MTVTINTLGTNSRQIVISDETSATNIIDAVNTSLVALGWTLIDTVISGSRKMLTTAVYSAINADAVTTKYMIIRYDLQRQYWFTSCAESWNTTTDTATNESWYGNRHITLPLQYSNCTLYVFATARYACFMGVVQGEPSAWQGVFEFEREAAEDIATPTTPCFGWTSSLTIGEPYGNIVIPVANSTPATSTVSTANGFVASGFAPPRTKDGLTGTAAAGNFTILTAIGSYSPMRGQIGLDFTGGGVTQALNAHNSMLGSFGAGQTYVWNNTKTLISNIKLSGYTNNYVVGKIYGLKVTVTLGNVLDTTTVPVDANLFYSSTGSNTTHYLLGINGGYDDRIAVAANRITASAFTSGTAFGTPWQSVLVGGRYLYFTTTTGFHKFDIQNQSITLNILPAAQYYSVKFDGENSLYVTSATANTIYKVNLTNDTNTTLSMTGSWRGLAIDDNNLYVASSATGSTTTVKRVALSTFTEAETYTITTGIASGYITHMTTANYEGYLYVASLTNGLAANNKITRVLVSNASQLTLTPTATFNNTSTTFISGAQPIYNDGQNLWFFNYSDTGAGTSNLQTRTERVRLSDFSLASEFASSAATTALVPFNNDLLKSLGSFEMPSYAGMILCPVNTSASSLRIVTSDPRVGTISALPLNFNNFDSLTLTGQGATDGCNLLMFSGTTQIIRYTNATRNYNFNGAQSANLLIAQ